MAALDHQPMYAAAVEILAYPLHVHRLAAVDDGRHGAESFRPRSRLAWRSRPPSRCRRPRRSGRGIQPPPSGDGDLDRRRRQSAGQPLVPSRIDVAAPRLSLRTVAAPTRMASQWRVRRRPGRSRLRWTGAAVHRRTSDVAVDRHGAAHTVYGRSATDAAPYRQAAAPDPGGSLVIPLLRGTWIFPAAGAWPRPVGDPRRDCSQCEHAVHGSRSKALGGAEAGSGERPGGDPFTRAPSADVHWNGRREEHEHRQRQQPDGGSEAPAVRAARAAWPCGRRRPRRTPARWPAPLCGANRPSRMSVAAARKARAQRDAPRGGSTSQQQSTAEYADENGRNNERKPRRHS